MKIEIKQGNTYLVKSNDIWDEEIKSVTILLITDTSYQIRWNNNKNNIILWETKKEFIKYTIIEDISKIVIEFPKSLEPQLCNCDSENFKSTSVFETCVSCNGTGEVLCTNTTAGRLTCPTCCGSKIILKKLTVED